MDLYVFRHGIAENRQAGRPDAERQLTDEGKKKAADVVKAARAAGVEPSLILSSPLIRALQTARIAADGFGYKGDIVQTAALEPEGTPEGIWKELRNHHGEASVLIAGHEPLLSHAIAYFLGSPDMRIDLKKAAMVRIGFDSFRGAPHGVLCWMITPKLV
jgi:phosphohistidine phosphatase